jgi:predicted Zn-dependent protease
MEYRRVIKWTIVACAAAALLAGVGYGGYRWYKSTKATRLLASARASVAKSDYRSASLFLRQVFETQPENVEATRMMAEITETLQSPNALSWRRKAAELEPHVLQHHLAWARLAMLQDQFPIAEQALLAVPATNRNSALYHHVSAAVALGMKKPREAEAHAAEALKLDPPNELYQFDVAAIRLQLGGSNIVADARAAIERLAQHPRLGCDALNALIGDAVRHKQLARATTLSRQLQTRDCVKFHDRLEYLEILKQSDPSAIDSFLTSILPDAEKNAGDVFQLSAWMLKNGRVDAAAEWLSRLPPAAKAKQPVRAAIADAYVARQEWARLENFLSNQNWGDMDAMRMALLSRALKEQGDKRKARTTWNMAVHKAAPQPETLMLLARASGGWGWAEETDDVLWRIAERPVYVSWALKNLYARYQERGDTRSLHRVVSEVIRLNPEDDGAKNNFCVFSYLLGINTEKAASYARELYEKYPTNSTVVTTYAFAMHKEKKTRAALEALKTLSSEQLREPSVAVYYGLILAESGAQAQANEYLQLGQSASLLPEEKALLAKLSR